ncbi:arabinan endo-1,5-alpha-L-arabinosidase [Limisphaera sp. VF-2]|jgi:arabinan endo-1,5-alpha-L-arabinosidase|uniref:arabinan endo-1,5-alpha-L-arabinosidase n=1 Tax=Limisphaera sp. VF-2 TaxID=3400418 RepID=UPI001758A20C
MATRLYPTSDRLRLRIAVCMLVGPALVSEVFTVPGTAATAGKVETAPMLRGATRIHDPSTIVRDGNRWWVFGTGRGILTLWSSNRVDWEMGPSVLREPPAWATEWVPDHRFRYWAPDIIRVKDRYYLYYSVSTWGSRQSAIGLLVGRRLDPEAPDHGWEDRGPVVRTTPQDDYNAIDPALFQDRDGRLWMVFGSYWSGIKLVELDPDTGLRKEPKGTVIDLAWKEAIEAAALLRQGDDYFLFVNWGQCCRGTNSTYEIRVGRSRSVTGPYVDREGRDLRKGGGTLLLGSSGRFIGPGHAAFFEADGQLWMSYHFYDGAQGGRSALDILPVQWDAEGWPQVKGRRDP